MDLIDICFPFLQDPENQLTYEIENQNNANEFFNIDPFTGLIRVSKRLTQSTPNVYSVSIISFFALFLSLSLSAFPLNLWGYFFTFVAVFLLHLFIIFGVGLPAYLSSHNPFSREHIFCRF